MNEWMSEWMNEWMSEWMNEWMNEWINFIYTRSLLQQKSTALQNSHVIKLPFLLYNKTVEHELEDSETINHWFKRERERERENRTEQNRTL